MSYHWYDLLGNLGVLLILLAYWYLQRGKLHSNAIFYSLANFTGALFILVSLYFDFNLSAFIIESAWLLISIYGIYRYYFVRQAE